MKHLLVLAGLFISIWIQAQVYDFPVKPGSAMWNNFETHQQMLDACQIPENVLSKMSTEDLVTTCLNYPLSIDCFAYDNEVKGVQQSVVDKCTGSIEIPQFGTKHSLNVSVTAGLVIWDFFKQLGI